MIGTIQLPSSKNLTTFSVLYKNTQTVCLFVMGLAQCPQGSSMLGHLTENSSHC